MNTALLRAPDRLSHGVRPDDRHGRAPGSAHGPAPPLAADLLAALDALAPEEDAGAGVRAPAVPEAAVPPGEPPCTGFVILPRRRL